MADHLDERLDDFRHGEHLRDLNNIESAFQHLRMVFDLMDVQRRRLGRPSRAPGGPAARVGEQLPRVARGGAPSGQVVARRQVCAVIEQARYQAGDASFFLTLPAAYEASGCGADAGRARVAAGRARVVDGVERARAAFGALAGYLEQTYLPSARAADAVGNERYLRLCAASSARASTRSRPMPGGGPRCTPSRPRWRASPARSSPARRCPR